MSIVPRRGHKVYRKKGAKLSPEQMREVKAVLGKAIEMKYFDFGFANTAFTSTPSFYLMTSIPQGPSDKQRVGDRIDIRSLECFFQATGGDIYNTIRVVIFKWKQDSAGVTPTAADLYDATASGAEYVMCPVPALEQDKKFTICYDHTISLSQTYTFTSTGATTTVIPTADSVKTWKVKLFGKRLGPKNINFNPGLSTGWGHYYLAVATDSAITPNPGVYFNCRVKYHDA